MPNILIGRKEEQLILKKALESEEAEMISIKCKPFQLRHIEIQKNKIHLFFHLNSPALRWRYNNSFATAYLAVTRS